MQWFSFSLLNNYDKKAILLPTDRWVGSSTPSGMATGNRQEKRLEVSKLCAGVGRSVVL